MKKLILILISVLSALQLSAQKVTFSNKTPEPGQPLSFTYDPTDGALDKLANVKCAAYVFNNVRQNNISIPLTKEGTVYKGTFTPADSTAFCLFTFSADGTKDENPNGYYTLFYNAGKPTAMAYYWEGQFYSGMGAAYAGITSDKPKALIAFEKAFEMDPKIKLKGIVPYLGIKYALDKESGEKLIDEEIVKLNKMAGQKEEDLIRIGNLYGISKRTAAADSVFKLVRVRFPKGTLAYNAAYSSFYNEKDATKIEDKLNYIIKNFELDINKKADATKITNLYRQAANIYASAKNNVKFEEYASKIASKASQAVVYNAYASTSAEKKESLEFALGISKKSLDLIEQLRDEPMPANYDASKEDYLNGLDKSYATYADTYAQLLGHLGKNAEALKFEEIAVTKNNFENAEMNGRYVSFLAKNGQLDKVKTYAEKFIKSGKATDQVKVDLKAVYKGSEPFETYYLALGKEALEREKSKFRKEMINLPAPKFSLVNLKGETVSLAQLKGKVVIVDYWATWCGPCIASFPGMQKAVSKYKNDPNVVFLFINTWQTEDNREKLVKDWMAANPQYTFNVLLDTKNVKDPSRFDVIEQYKVEGIPTKFIVDGAGNIRFKKVGFEGTVESTVKELDMMIALARETKQVSK